MPTWSGCSRAPTSGSSAEPAPGGDQPREHQQQHRRIVMTYVIAQPCVDVKDKGCVAACPVDCIYEGPRSMYIHPEECIDCGACEPACPTQAIYYEEDVPSRWRFFHQAN